MRMLAEERQLRDRIREYAPTLYEEKRMLSFLTAIKKAVREYDAKLAESMYGLPNTGAKLIADALRRK